MNNPGYRRFFAFGCSFTKWKWATWADYLAAKLGIEYYNFAEPGVGNEYIFHKVVETNAKYNFNKNDLVIICWTNFAREDRYKNNRWIPSNNIFKYQVYNKAWVDQCFDLKGALIKTSSFVASTSYLLKQKKSTYLSFSMMPMMLINSQDPVYQDLMVEDVIETYQKYYQDFLPSMVEYLYDSLPYCVNPEPQEHGDNHPSEKQHQKFVNKVLLPKLGFI